tara:strand:- start:441 stop:566 length:126 start_codon:yes stop_codon:yes gene_type:complete
LLDNISSFHKKNTDDASIEAVATQKVIPTKSLIIKPPNYFS